MYLMMNANSLRCLAKLYFIVAVVLCVSSIILLYTELKNANNYTKGIHPISRHGDASEHAYPSFKNGRATSQLKNDNITKLPELISHQHKLIDNFECINTKKVLDLNCSNIQEIKLGTQLGFGWYRKTFVGMFRGLRVVVKFINNEGYFMTKYCTPKQLQILKARDRHDVLNGRNDTKAYNETYLDLVSRNARKICRDIIANISKHEIYLSQTLKHPVLIPLLGYCIRNQTVVSGRYDVRTADVVSVWEFGKQATGYEFNTWQLRIQHCLKLIDFLLYFEKRSILLGDIKRAHFMFSCGEYKLIDFQEMTNRKPENKIFNAQVNMKKMRHYIFKHLLNIGFPPDVLDKIQPLKADVLLEKEEGESGLTASQWLAILTPIKELIFRE